MGYLIFASSLQGYTPDKFIKDKIYMEALEGAKICYLINILSGAYVNMSKKHLMHRIAGKSITFVNCKNCTHNILDQNKANKPGFENGIMTRKYFI